ncbi:MAG: reverse transcriptase family protein, partial [Gammaproteobacteria bacterium]|nr:reverse transcriptase family protein [Gammaproteobacteria bacterium]
MNEATDYFMAELCRIQSIIVPHKEVSLRKPLTPWMDKPLLRLLQRKQCAFGTLKTDPSNANRAKFKKLTKKVRAAVRVAKRDYITKSFEGVTSIKDLFTVANRFLGMKNKATSPLLLDDGSYIVESCDKVRVWADQFMKNFNATGPGPLELLPIDGIACEWFCTEDDVLGYINQIRNSAAIGLHGISPLFLKKCAFELAGPISSLINLSLWEGSFPNAWKEAKVTPIPKVPNPTSPSDFRPISVLPAISKICELHMRKKLGPFVFDKPDQNQFAYYQGRSTEDAIALLQYYITEGLCICPGATKVAVVSLDISKAFDQVPTHNLVKILRGNFGLPDPLALWIQSYLSDRFQTVVSGRNPSEKRPVVSGVVQGSILGPNLFTAYISGVMNLHLSDENSRLIGFADDLVLIRPIVDDSDERTLQEDLCKIIREYAELFLHVNPEKSKFILFTKSPRPVSLNSPPSINGTEVQRVSNLKYLGVIFDEHLSFGPHIESLCARGKAGIGVLYRAVAKWGSREIFGKLYSLKTGPMLFYALPVASPTLRKHWILIEKTHRFASRLCSNNFTDSYEDLLRKLHWKTVAKQCVERQLLLMHKYVNGTRFIPPFVWEHRRDTGYVFRGHVRHDLQRMLNAEPFSCKSASHQRQTVGNAPFYFAVRTWNSLPEELCSQTF